ncbi:type II secretion system protein GspL [Halieaceae bacterium IMCC14734]|uniref:Type II secretion system protein L n=1 Tax=Candidatus Litorirhabdus singularis TaxID=2518993 RepID=A0ABT3TG87_9GAMM|nr:type II secretion system protein GspL [Candidatus Litorirhabdus singularis]MCX2981049.1 type II secretion system protein GspL [Candidatus Litorirhabdus singularis]
MRDSAVVRIIDDELFWYPPGANAEPRPLSDESQAQQLRLVLQGKRAPVIFAVPGGDLCLREFHFTAAERRHIRKSLPFLLEAEFANDAEDLHVAAQPVAKLSLAVASCAHRCMQDWLERLQAFAGITQWQPEPLLLPWREGEVTVVNEGHMAIVRSGHCTGFSVEPEMLATMLAALPQETVTAVIIYGQDQQGDTELIPVELREKVQWRKGGFAAALMLSGDVSPRLNLRQQEYGISLPLRQWWQQWRWPVILLGSAFSLQVAASYVDYSQLEAENLKLRGQIQSAYRDVNPRGAIVDPEKQLNRQLTELRGSGGSSNFVSLLESVGAVIQSQQGTQLATINYSSKLGEVRVTLLAPDFKAVESVRSQLASAGLEAEMENSNAQGEQVRARLRVGRK